MLNVDDSIWVFEEAKLILYFKLHSSYIKMCMKTFKLCYGILNLCDDIIEDRNEDNINKNSTMQLIFQSIMHGNNNC